jgi:hypothetical protein
MLQYHEEDRRPWQSTIPFDERPVVVLGLDLGQTRNHTAIAVVESRFIRATPWEFLASASRAHAGYWDHKVIALERLDLDTSYVDVAHWVKDYLDRIFYPCHKHLVMDGTGVGTAVRDMFRSLNLQNTNLVPVTITGSTQAGWRPASAGTGGGIVTSRTEILTKLLTSIEQEQFTINKDCRERETLFHELVNLKLSGKPESSSTSGGQDDLAMALSLALYWALRSH